MGKEAIRVVQFGLGYIGCATARLIQERVGLDLVGGVDVDPQKAGKDLGPLIEWGELLGIEVVTNLSAVVEKSAPDVVLHTTSSHFSSFKEQILKALEAGLDVVSTSEELSFPWNSHSRDAEEIDTVAKRFGKTVLGTGVNPGFIMDCLPLYLTSICKKVEKIDIVRSINASKRRGPFQAKIGAGMKAAEFETKMRDGSMGHVGLRESTEMILDTLGKRLDRYESSVEPILAQQRISTDHFDVRLGEVSGLRQVAQAYSDGREYVSLTFVAALDWEEDFDSIRIEGEPSLQITLKGAHGDMATAAIAVNAIKRVHEAPAGLVTMRDLPVITCCE